VVIQSELRLVPIDDPKWSPIAHHDYLLWHTQVQTGQTAKLNKFLFLGGTGNGFRWDMLAGVSYKYGKSGISSDGQGVTDDGDKDTIERFMEKVDEQKDRKKETGPIAEEDKVEPTLEEIEAGVFGLGEDGEPADIPEVSLDDEGVTKLQRDMAELGQEDPEYPEIDWDELGLDELGLDELQVPEVTPATRGPETIVKAMERHEREQAEGATVAPVAEVEDETAVEKREVAPQIESDHPLARAVAKKK